MTIGSAALSDCGSVAALAAGEPIARSKPVMRNAQLFAGTAARVYRALVIIGGTATRR